MITPIDRKDIPGTYSERGSALRDIREFLKSDASCCEVEIGGRVPKSVHAQCCALRKKHGLPIRILFRSDRVFLVKTEVEE